MTAHVIRFPARHSQAIWLARERDADGWLVIAGAHGWVFGSSAPTALG
jgi:hypothetical protein